METALGISHGKAKVIGMLRTFRDSNDEVFQVALKDAALKFIQYILSPEGQARLATSSCYWGMPANAKAALDDDQKKILRFDDQPGFLKRAQEYPAPSEDLDKKMQDLWTAMIQGQ
jgi:spermidine/putrescine transport system substrate-binding protein